METIENVGKDQSVEELLKVGMIICGATYWNLPPLQGKDTHKPQGAHTISTTFCSMQQLGVLLLPPRWDASPLQHYPQH